MAHEWPALDPGKAVGACGTGKRVLCVELEGGSPWYPVLQDCTCSVGVRSAAVFSASSNAAVLGALSVTVHRSLNV